MNIIIQFFLQTASTKIMAKLIQTETIVVTTKNTQKIVVLLMMMTLMQMKCAADVRIKVIFSLYSSMYIRNRTKPLGDV